MALETAAQIAKLLIKVFTQGNTAFFIGNGGSATQAAHFAGELICTFENKDRDPLPAWALTTNPAIMTAWPNDRKDGFEDVYARQIKALAHTGDCLVSLSTSGKSKNCLRAMEVARDRGMFIVDFPRQGKTTAEIQEFQLKLMHDVCRIVEKHYL